MYVPYYGHPRRQVRRHLALNYGDTAAAFRQVETLDT